MITPSDRNQLAVSLSQPSLRQVVPVLSSLPGMARPLRCGGGVNRHGRTASAGVRPGVGVIDVACVRGVGTAGTPPYHPVPASLRCAIPQVSRHSDLSHRTCPARVRQDTGDGPLAVGSSTSLHMTRRLAIRALDSERAAGTYSTFARRVITGQHPYIECSKKTLVVLNEVLTWETGS
jgi:hypothetical protein